MHNQLNPMETKTLYEGEYAFAHETLYNREDRLTKNIPFYHQLIAKHHIESVLDAGCGNGFHLLLLHKFSEIKKIIGMDYSKHMIESARYNLKDNHISSIKLVQSDFQHANRKIKEKFDLVVCSFGISALENEKDVVTSLKSFRHLLTGTGILVIEDTNGDWITHHPKEIDTRPIEAPFFDIIKRQNLTVRISERMKFPRIFSSAGKRILAFGFPMVYKFMKQKSRYIRLYHHIPQNLINDHIFIRQGFFKRIDIENYRTRCLVLPKNKLIRFLRLAGFKKIEVFSDFDFRPPDDESYRYLFVAR